MTKIEIMRKNKTIFAAGSDIKNRFLFAKGKEIYPGPDIGDLNDADNYEKFTKAAARLSKKTGMCDIAACDLHPGYFSSKFTEARGKGRRHLRIQHHHAHVASVILEHALTKPVIGVCFDGTGYGADGHIWGGEFLVVDKKGFERAAHLKYRKMPGGDRVVAEPWRMALSVLGERGVRFIKKASKKDKDLILKIMAKDINSPLTSSAGRLFDAAAALLGICVYAAGEAEGPVKLESICDVSERGSYAFRTTEEDDRYIIDAKGLFLGMARDIEKMENGKGKRKREKGKGKKEKGKIAARFHNSMSRIIVETVRKISKRTGIKEVALTGGVFQNNFLKAKATCGLEKDGFRVFVNETLPANDLNIAFGQYFVAKNM